MEYLTSYEVSMKWDILNREVRKLCGEGRGEVVAQKGNLWLISECLSKPKAFQRDKKKG